MDTSVPFTPDTEPAIRFRAVPSSTSDRPDRPRSRTGRVPVGLDALLVRHDRLPAWVYTGPLDRGIALAHQRCVSLTHRLDGPVHVVESEQAATGTDPRRHSATTADTEESAWRAHLGLLFGDDKPHPDDADPGETLIRYRSRQARAAQRPN